MPNPWITLKTISIKKFEGLRWTYQNFRVLPLLSLWLEIDDVNPNIRMVVLRGWWRWKMMVVLRWWRRRNQWKNQVGFFSFFFFVREDGPSRLPSDPLYLIFLLFLFFTCKGYFGENKRFINELRLALQCFLFGS